MIVNTKGAVGDISNELRELIRYLDSGDASGTYTRELEEAVNDVKASEERRLEYVNMMIREMEIRAEGRAEGREEGRAEGREEGRAEERELAVRSLMEKMGWTDEQARRALGYAS